MGNSIRSNGLIRHVTVKHSDTTGIMGMFMLLCPQGYKTSDHSQTQNKGKQPINALYFEFETVLKFYNLEANRHPGVEEIHLYSCLVQKVSEYDQEIPRSHTADQPMASCGTATEHLLKIHL